MVLKMSVWLFAIYYVTRKFVFLPLKQLKWRIFFCKKKKYPQGTFLSQNFLNLMKKKKYLKYIPWENSTLW